ncbi:BQ2448_4590 [Microbotryum intermedium]|uniref:Altered inheritance of mitochondria protein 41 n=1 Tax=Microbotryum intermedium TaxID=269621 RepID=A0A238FLE0_9BASI|nr:BQ2448_4590 [Microbotryum intermedium]
MASLLKAPLTSRALLSTAPRSTHAHLRPATSPFDLARRCQSSSSSSPAASTLTAAPTLDATLRQALKGYMKSRATFESGVIKSILADLQTTSHLASPPNPHKVLLRSIKTRLEAATQFTSSTPPRQDLADQYTREAQLLQQFVQASESEVSGMDGMELEGIIKASLEEVKVEKAGEDVGVKDLGRVIKLVLAKTKGKVGGKGVSEAVKKYFEASVPK